MKVKIRFLDLVLNIELRKDYYYYEKPPKYTQHYHWIKKAYGLPNRYDKMMGFDDPEDLDTLPF